MPSISAGVEIYVKERVGDYSKNLPKIYLFFDKRILSEFSALMSAAVFNTASSAKREGRQNYNFLIYMFIYRPAGVEAYVKSGENGQIN